ncbi:MAG: redox-regulated ATPase YchF [Rhodospirillales bacterium]|jgi:ribosome-binding ATPase|nr:redox-regulated ATPase YchF [Rhodospirillales bacterium]
MGFNCGIVGLPNVGKSTLFNALTETAAADSANYPFCTIEPNTGRVAVPDARLDRIFEITGSAKRVPTHLEFVDIAGLVRGASKGEGLGNQFLGNIREVDAIIHVLRCFEDENITHTEATIDPVRDAEVVSTELLLADLESLERRVEATAKRAKGGDKELVARLAVMEPVLAVLQDGLPARKAKIAPDQMAIFHQLQLLTAKPVLYACNVEEASIADGNGLAAAVAEMADAEGSGSVVVSAHIESEISQLADAAEKQEFLETMGLTETGLTKVIRAGYGLLDLLTFFTTGPKESRAWTVRAPATAPEAAGAIHTDFQRGFICAETIAYDDFVALGGEHGAKDAGKMRQEGRNYQVRDGDVMLFRFNV